MDDQDAAANDSANRPLWFGAIGAVAGAIAGYVLFFLTLKYASLYALVLPGALIGLGRLFGTRTVSIPLGIACGLGALVLSLSIEYQVTPGAAEEGIADFLRHVHERPFRNVASIIAGPGMALWFGIGRKRAGT